MIFVVRDKESKKFRSGNGKNYDLTDDLERAMIYRKLSLVETLWWFNAEIFEIVPVKLEIL
jgi:hypothetical protein